MKVGFVDDTKQVGKRQGMGKLVALGAVVFPVDHLRCFDDRLRDSFDALEIPASSEVKWSVEKNSFFRLEGKDVLTPARQTMLDQAALCGARAVVVIWDSGRTSKSSGAVEAAVLKYLYERVSMLLSSDPGILIFDKPGGGQKEEDRWIEENTSLVRAGTEYVLPGKVALPPLTAASHHHRHLQLADLVAGALTAAVAGENKYAEELLPKIRPIMHTNSWNGIAGAGLKLYPDALANLYRVALAEDALIRNSMGTPLPIAAFPYAYEAGETRVAPLDRVSVHDPETT
jgi:hypothetical protein